MKRADFVRSVTSLARASVQLTGFAVEQLSHRLARTHLSIHRDMRRTKTTKAVAKRTALMVVSVLNVRVSIRALNSSKWGLSLSSSDQNLDFQDTLPGGPLTIPNPVEADAERAENSGAIPPAMGRSASTMAEERAIRFTGEGGEYFKIWAVNLALTIVTLGIFSAWAKVRRLRYFYANTSLTGSTFDFHGAPAAILRGRIIALVILIGYTQAPKISLTLYGVVAVFILTIFPWLYWRSLRFRMGNTSFRGARFNFTGDLGTAYQILLPPAALFLSVNIIVAIVTPSVSNKTDAFYMIAKVGTLYCWRFRSGPTTTIGCVPISMAMRCSALHPLTIWEASASSTCWPERFSSSR